MKKFKLFTLIFASIVIAGTGCVKDKGFEDHKYGINDPDASPIGVGFTLGSAFLNSTGLTLSDQSQIFDTSAVKISLLSGNPASNDVHVTVAVDPNIVSTYNADTTHLNKLTPLDASYFSLATTTITIPAGQRNAYLVINVPSTTTLSPDSVYGLGLRIISADGGYQVAGNEDELLLSIAIKNIYDGDYTSNGYFYHPTAPREIVDYPKTLSTVNATSVTCYLGDLGPNGYVAVFDVDPTTNHVTVTAAAGAAGGPYQQFDTGLPTTNPGYTPQWPGSAECNNVWDPVELAFKMRYGYVGGSGFRVSEEIIKKD